MKKKVDCVFKITSLLSRFSPTWFNDDLQQMQNPAKIYHVQLQKGVLKKNFTSTKVVNITAGGNRAVPGGNTRPPAGCWETQKTLDGIYFIYLIGVFRSTQDLLI